MAAPRLPDPAPQHWYKERSIKWRLNNIIVILILIIKPNLIFKKFGERIIDNYHSIQMHKGKQKIRLYKYLEEKKILSFFISLMNQFILTLSLLISVHEPSLFLTILYDVLALKTYETINPQILFCPPLYTPLCLSVKRRQTQSSFYPFQFGHLLFQLFLLILYHWCFCLTATLIRYIIVTGTLPVCLSIFIKLLIGQGKIYNYFIGG